MDKKRKRNAVKRLHVFNDCNQTVRVWFDVKEKEILFPQEILSPCVPVRCARAIRHHRTNRNAVYMSDTTNISFADHTGSPWIGCTKVNTDCINCYADELDRNRFSKTLGGGTKDNPIRHWGKGAPRLRTRGFWGAAINWNRRPWVCNKCGQCLATPDPAHGCKGFHRARAFPSLCDWLDSEVDIAWMVDFLKVVYDTPNLDWMLFTKRPELFPDRMGLACNALNFLLETARMADSWNPVLPWMLDWLHGKTAPSNVWVFASAGCQKTYDQMIDHLQCIPALVRGISCEPMTGPIDFAFEADDERPTVVIFGGESGRNARPCHIHWIEEGIEQCQDNGVLPYVKQLGSKPIMAGCDGELEVHLKHSKGGDPAEWPEHLRLRELPVVERV